MADLQVRNDSLTARLITIQAKLEDVLAGVKAALAEPATQDIDPDYPPDVKAGAET